MLWTASQHRLTRESRERRAELYQAGRDSFVDGAIAAGLVKARGARRLPDYLRGEPDPDAAKRGLAQLMHDYPRHIARGGRRFAN